MYTRGQLRKIFDFISLVFLDISLFDSLLVTVYESEFHECSL